MLNAYITAGPPSAADLGKLPSIGPRFAAVLLDLTMPGLNGAEVIREIRAMKQDARILVMSGFSEQDILDRLAGLGPVEILHKPFTREMLLAHMAKTVSGQQARE